MQAELSKLRRDVERFAAVPKERAPWRVSVKKRKVRALEDGSVAYVDDDRLRWIYDAYRETEAVAQKDEEYASTYDRGLLAFVEAEARCMGHHVEFLGFLEALLYLIKTDQASEELLRTTEREMSRGPEAGLLDFVNGAPETGLIVLAEARRVFDSNKEKAS